MSSEGTDYDVEPLLFSHHRLRRESRCLFLNLACDWSFRLRFLNLRLNNTPDNRGWSRWRCFLNNDVLFDLRFGFRNDFL